MGGDRISRDRTCRVRVEEKEEFLVYTVLWTLTCHPYLESATALSDRNYDPPIRKRGRPKGHEVTVIGLPAKKSKMTNNHSSIKLHTSVKERSIHVIILNHHYGRCA